MDVKIVPVAQSHISPIMALNKECMPENYDVMTHLTHVKLFGDINYTAIDQSQKDKDGQPLVVGYIMGRVKDNDSEADNRGHITSIAVSPAYRGQKIATKLMLYALVGMNRRGLKSCTLECRTDNEIGISLYKRAGFEVESIRKNYYDSEEDDGKKIDGFYMLKTFK